MNLDYESNFRTLITHAWDNEVTLAEIESWANNFQGEAFLAEEEELYALFALTRFMYFGKRLVREMLKSLYRDHFESPLKQRVRRHLRGVRDSKAITDLYRQELSATRFVGVGNPAESGAHLLYYFRQINHLYKGLFVDMAGAFTPSVDERTKKLVFKRKEESVTRYVFFDDLVGSGMQASSYLSKQLHQIRISNPNVELRFMCLFATTDGLAKMNEPSMFDGKAMCLFELDNTYRAFDSTSRYFANAPDWFDPVELAKMFKLYGSKLFPTAPLGYSNSQLLLGFSHNTPDNVPPVFWDEGNRVPWCPIFIRYDKNYEEITP